MGVSDLDTSTSLTAEENRLREARGGVVWRRWGPYLSERQWGTVREDYSESGDAWSYLSHDQARSRAYRWGEDGLAGVSDDEQRLCLALALWNERDPILKERLFGLTNSEGNHGEDVKEYYFYLDNLPTHSYQRWLYKYPHAEFPYTDLVAGNRVRSRTELEYELVDTGVFDDGRYFDVEVEHAKAGPEDIVCRVTVHNRSAEDAALHVLPTLWFRNDWSWSDDDPRPRLARVDAAHPVVRAEHEGLGVMYLHAEAGASLLFCENETNSRRLWGNDDGTPFAKDGIGEHLIHGVATVNPAAEGTKVAAHTRLAVAAGGQASVLVRFTREGPDTMAEPFADAERLIAQRRSEADEFYESITPPAVEEDARSVMRQALAGMLWSKQCYYFDVDRWLRERHAHPLRGSRRHGSRNESWFHMLNYDVVSMPDKWEYPWYAAWDLAFHCIPLALVDPDFARDQINLMLSQEYLHPSGQIPAYEWNFGDVNPPVHAFATLFLHKLQSDLGEEDFPFVEECFSRLLVNFTWWVNRKDPTGRNLFEGGFLGLDNIGVFDRSAALPTGGSLEQADGTAWMALFSQNMLDLALSLLGQDESYERFVRKFVEHFFWIAAAVDPIGEHPDEMWDEEDGFFYDVLRLPDGTGTRIKVRSLVGLLPICATTVIEADVIERYPQVAAQIRAFLERNRDLLANIADPLVPGVNGRRLLSLVNEDKLRRILTRMLDEERFLGPHGIRSISRWHLDHPYVFDVAGVEHRVQYEPAESTSGMFGGNSNWRGPVWFPINMLLVRALLQHYRYYGDDFTIECPTGSGTMMTLYEVAGELSRRLVTTFLRDGDGRRPVYGATRLFQEDPHWRDLILFYEYFHGDNGAGLGASHQTGWTGLVARLIQGMGQFTPAAALTDDQWPFARPYRRLAVAQASAST
ncbi:MAG: MGH1-like glycoside hydrolase domain-containing protein, partial [Solirubrobacteraceae bacterium]